jgi:phage replication O-like protein O
MASPQTQNGYLRIANELWDALLSRRIPAQSRSVFDAIIRLTWGFNKKSEHIPLLKLMEMTDMPERQVCKAIAWLKKANMIARERSGETKINKDFETWELSTPAKNGICQKRQEKPAKNGRSTSAKNGRSFTYIERQTEKTIKDITDDRKTGDKSEGRRRMEAARNLLAEKMTM